MLLKHVSDLSVLTAPKKRQGVASLGEDGKIVPACDIYRLHQNEDGATVFWREHMSMSASCNVPPIRD